MKVYENFSLVNNNSYKINSVCKKAYFPESEIEIVELFSNYNRRNKDLIVIGSGHNIILSKEKYDESFVILNNTFDRINFENDILEVESGAWMKDVAIFSMEKSLSGLEIFYDIPSSLGGAIVMNAGASGIEIKDFLLKVRYLDLNDFLIKELNSNQILFEYRNSFFQNRNDLIILKAFLKLNRGDKADIITEMKRIKDERNSKQPKDFPNAGSVFKRPKGYFVGSIMDELGLKGFRVGDAQVSNKHGGFIINLGNATGRDIIELIDIINNKVSEHYGFKLDVEQRII